MISFDFYSTHYKVYIHLTYIITQWQTTAPLDITHIISSSDRQSPRLYQGSADCGEGYRNSDIIRLLQPSQTIHYCNQSVLEIFPDLNIFVWNITIFDLISKNCPGTVLFYYVLAICITQRVLRFYNFGSLPDSRVRDCHLSQVSALYCYYWNMVLRFLRYRYVCIKYGYTMNCFVYS